MGGWIEMHSVRMIVARLEPDPARLEQSSTFRQRLICLVGLVVEGSNFPDWR